MIMRIFRSLLIGLLVMSVTTAAVAQDAPPIPGQIAVVGTDYNVYLLDPQSGREKALTDDAAVSNAALRVYGSPVWSVGGELAYFGTWANSTGLGTDVLIAPDANTPAFSAATLPDLSITYASWSPQPCGDSCRDLALLMSKSSSFVVDLVRAQGTDASVTETGTGAPFYFSWSPDGTQMLWQRDGARLDIFDITQGKVATRLPQTPGAMFAPAWSPIDDRLLFAAQNGTASDLVIAANGELQTLMMNQPNPLLFGWSPNGNQIAYIDRHGPLTVVDPITGDVVAQSTDSNVQAFFWSPDSRHIAYVTEGLPVSGSFNASAPSGIKVAAPMQQSASALTWSVIDVADSVVRRYGSFMPTHEETYMLSFFDQFGQSHRVWSPDSRYLVYGELTPARRSVISLLDTTQNVAVPLVIAEGVVGVWSYE